MARKPLSRRLAANLLAGLIWLPTVVFVLFGAKLLAALALPELVAVPTLWQALPAGLAVVLAGASALAAAGRVPDERLARALLEEGLPKAERVALGGRSPTVMVALGAWPVAASLAAIALGGYFNVSLMFVVAWALATGALFPNGFGDAGPRS